MWQCPTNLFTTTLKQKAYEHNPTIFFFFRFVVNYKKNIKINSTIFCFVFIKIFYAVMDDMTRCLVCLTLPFLLFFSLLLPENICFCVFVLIELYQPVSQGDEIFFSARFCFLLFVMSCHVMTFFNVFFIRFLNK